MAFIYQADIYCDECGKLIKKQIRAEGHAPENPRDESSYDSDEYPKHASDDEETDSPQHCGSGAECVNAIELSDGSKIGCLIGTNLTTDGIAYVKQAVQEGGLCAIEVWKEEFDIDFDEDEEDEEDDDDVVDDATLVRIAHLDRDECVALLEGVGIQCYDHETLGVLQEAVRVNVADGTIQLD